MCGIVGYVGNRETIETLINGLKRLEYRGYDSAGLAVLVDGQMHVLKSAGKVQTLADRVEHDWPESLRREARIGIAHTRWATHGPPTDVNAHPHLDPSGTIAVVHNGIIENYAPLRRQLEAQGHVFLSETDTEVISHLVAQAYKGDLFAAVCETLRKLEGTFGLAVLSVRDPGLLVVARRGSPLLIGVGDGETLVASDASAVVSHTRRVIYLNDDDVAAVQADTVDVRSIHNLPVTREVARIDWDTQAAEKGGHAHFMLKEIFEQPDAIRNSIRGRLDDTQGTAKLAGLALAPREIVDIHRLVLVACGTSLHAGMVGRYFFEEFADLPADIDQAAEFRYRNPIIGSHDLVLAISQSGETADTLAAVREAKQKGALVASICNVVASTIARETGRGVYLHAGPEIGVASTKAFTCQVAVLLMMALKFGRCRRLSRAQGVEIAEAIQRIPDLVAETLQRNSDVAAAAAEFAQARDFFFIGRGTMYPAALEGALKLKEISYIHAEGYHAAELKHGPIALLDADVPVVALATQVPGKEKTVGNIQECRARHAPVIAIISEGDTETADAVRKLASRVLTIPAGPAITTPITSVVLMQLLAYHIARLRGCPIDQPRNLAKSVTVE